MTNYPHSDLTNGGVVRVEQKFYPEYMDEQYRHAVYIQLQDNFGCELYKAIQHCRHPVVVEVSEKRFDEIRNIYDKVTIIRLEARLTPVEHRNVVMEHLDHYYAYPPSMSHYRLYKKLDKILNFLKIK